MRNRRPGGFAEIRRDGIEMRACDTFTCAHGNEIVRCPPGTIGQAPFCTKCMKPICKACAAKMHRTLEHVPVEQMLDDMEATARRQIDAAYMRLDPSFGMRMREPEDDMRDDLVNSNFEVAAE